MGTINLATKYSPKVVDKFYLDSVVLGKTSKAYDWDGVNSIKVWTINTHPTTSYAKPANDIESPGLVSAGTAHARYGATYEVTDTIQTMPLTQDRAVSLSVDKGNNTEQMLIKNSGKVMNLEMREQFIPEFDKYCLSVWGNPANCGTVTELASPSKSNIVDAISAHVTALRNKFATVDDAYCFIGETEYAMLLMAPEFINYNNPAFAPQHLEKGVMGRLRGLQIVPVPDSYFVDTNINFVTAKSSCILAPTKIKDMKVHTDPVGISGALLEIRWLYDAFVLDTRKDGLAVCLKTDASV